MIRSMPSPAQSQRAAAHLPAVMKLTALALVLASGGCALYFGSPASSGDPDDPAAPTGPPADPPTDPTGGASTRCAPGAAEVHVFGMYESRSDHSPDMRPTGEASVSVERPGQHVLVLSSYEPTRWHVTLAPDARIRLIYLIGYYTQTVDLPGVPVLSDSVDNHRPGCGYSYPYNRQGCDTDQLLARVTTKVGELTTFHGCYRATQWTLHADGTATSNCDTAAGYQQYDIVRTCKTSSGWERAEFRTADPPSCTGERFVRNDQHYGVWVGAILCGSAQRYKLYMSEQRDQPFLQIADYAGHGQDHCELVNPTFTIPDEDDITSGGCVTCSVDRLVDVIGVPVYARAVFGERFGRVVSREWADLTTTSYACGVAIP